MHQGPPRSFCVKHQVHCVLHPLKTVVEADLSFSGSLRMGTGNSVLMSVRSFD